MVYLQWRRFNFFDKEVVKDPATDQAFEQLKVFIMQFCSYLKFPETSLCGVYIYFVYVWYVYKFITIYSDHIYLLIILFY